MSSVDSEVLEFMKVISVLVLFISRELHLSQRRLHPVCVRRMNCVAFVKFATMFTTHPAGIVMRFPLTVAV